MSEIVGVTYPIPKQFMDRFFKGKDVFIKPATVWKQLKLGMKFVFLSVSRRHIRKYDKPTKPKRFVPVGGQYLREGEMHRLRGLCKPS